MEGCQLREIRNVERNTGFIFHKSYAGVNNNRKRFNHRKMFAQTEYVWRDTEKEKTKDTNRFNEMNFFSRTIKSG